MTLWLRSGLREQILDREAEALTEVASLQLATEADTLAALGVKDAPGELLNAVLKTSKLRGVFAVRVFDAAKRFSGALPIPWSDLPPNEDIWRQMEHGRPTARLYSRESAAEVIGLAPASSAGRDKQPLMETWLPLRYGENGAFAGAAQMWTDGNAVAEEFSGLDRRLVLQAVLAWAAGSVIIATLLIWAFRQLARANRDLQARSDDLIRANRELTLAAKSSALGAVAAHLMHELKNPVAGLEELVAAQAEQAGRGEYGGELTAASDLTRRLRTMINDIVAVMRDEQSGVQFELTLAEMVELAIAKATPAANHRSVQLTSLVSGAATIQARRSNLIGLVLQNLLQNAVEASPSGATVRLTAIGEMDAARFLVEDQGTGLSEDVRARLFQPCASTKRGGSGLGLALSQQLARQAGGRIELIRTDTTGTTFQVIVSIELET